jgi:hypothetical protein
MGDSMSADDGDVFDSAPGQDTEYEYDDPDELYRVRRLTQILDSLKAYDKGKIRLRHHPQARRLPQDERAALRDELALAVVRNLEPIISRTERPLLQREVVLTADGGDMRTATLQDLLDAGGSIAERHTETQLDPDTNGMERVTKTRYYSMDEATADKVVRLCVDFLESVMPVNLTDDSRTADFDYSDLI